MIIVRESVSAFWLCLNLRNRTTTTTTTTTTPGGPCEDSDLKFDEPLYRVNISKFQFEHNITKVHAGRGQGTVKLTFKCRGVKPRFMKVSHLDLKITRTAQSHQEVTWAQWVVYIRPVVLNLFCSAIHFFKNYFFCDTFSSQIIMIYVFMWQIFRILSQLQTNLQIFFSFKHKFSYFRSI
jgi:hypothetical protein